MNSHLILKTKLITTNYILNTDLFCKKSTVSLWLDQVFCIMIHQDLKDWNHYCTQKKLCKKSYKSKPRTERIIKMSKQYEFITTTRKKFNLKDQSLDNISQDQIMPQISQSMAIVSPAGHNRRCQQQSTTPVL